MIINSYLKKLKSSQAKARFFSKFTRRWFVLDLNAGTFYYTKKESDKKPVESYNLGDVIGYDPNPRVNLVSD